MKASVNWVEGNTFLARSGSGHAVAINVSEGPDKPTIAPGPMEYVLIGTGGCTAFDVVHILRKGRHDVRGCVAELEAERATQEPKVFTRIHLHFVVTGKGLTPEVVKRAIDLSAEKYCSASIMLGKTATITHDFEIREAD